MAEVNDRLKALGRNLETRREDLDDEQARVGDLIEARLDGTVRQVFRHYQSRLASELAELDRDVDHVLSGYLAARDIPYSRTEEGGTFLYRLGPSERLSRGDHQHWKYPECTHRRHVTCLPGVHGVSFNLARAQPATGGVHFARWIIIDHLVQEEPDQAVDVLQGAWLLFSVIFDGDEAAFISRLHAGLGSKVAAIWGHCVGFQAAEGPGPFAAYLRRYRVDPNLLVGGYPNARLVEILEGLDLRKRLQGFLRANRNKDAITSKDPLAR